MLSVERVSEKPRYLREFSHGFPVKTQKMMKMLYRGAYGPYARYTDRMVLPSGVQQRPYGPYDNDTTRMERVRGNVSS
jgi:hypothetical protein